MSEVAGVSHLAIAVVVEVPAALCFVPRVDDIVVAHLTHLVWLHLLALLVLLGLHLLLQLLGAWLGHLRLLRGCHCRLVLLTAHFYSDQSG